MKFTKQGIWIMTLALLFPFVAHAASNSQAINRKMTDALITRTIKSRIAKNLPSEAANISVSTDSGFVKIEGSASNLRSFGKIARQAASVPGVKLVQLDKLRVDKLQRLNQHQKQMALMHFS